MTIAVCYSGFLRDIEKTYLNIIKNLIGDNDVLFYFHTWDVPEYRDEINFAKNEIQPESFCVEPPKNFELNPYTFINSKITPDEYKKQLNQSGEDKIYFEPPSEDNGYTFYKNLEVVKFKYYSTFPYNLLSQFYSTHQSNLIRKTSQRKFDAVIRLRSDLQFDEKIDITKFDLNSVNVINSPGHNGQLSVNDHFAIGSPEVMNTYFDLFLYIPTYYFVYNLDLIQEIYLANHLQIHGVNVIKHNIKNTIRRDTIHKEYNGNYLRN
jgi:hypothetical protein